MARVREHARSTYRWNKALCGMKEQVAVDPELEHEYRELIECAGFSPDISTGFLDGTPSHIES